MKRSFLDVMLLVTLGLCNSAYAGDATVAASGTDEQHYGMDWWMQHPDNGNYLCYRRFLDAETAPTVRAFSIDKVVGPNGSPDLASRLFVEREKWLRIRIANALIICADSTAKDALAQLLTIDSDPDLQTVALKGLMSLGDPRATAISFKYLDGDDIDRQKFALLNLPAQRNNDYDPHIIDLFQRSLASGHEDVTNLAITTLGHLQSEQALRPLLMAMESERDSLKHWPLLIPAIDSISNGRGTALKQELQDEDKRIAEAMDANQRAASSYNEYMANRQALMDREKQQREAALNAAEVNACIDWMKTDVRGFLMVFRRPFAEKIVATRLGNFEIVDIDSGTVHPGQNSDDVYVSDTAKYFVLITLEDKGTGDGVKMPFQFRIGDDGLLKYVGGDSVKIGTLTVVMPPGGTQAYCDEVEHLIASKYKNYRNPNAGLPPVEQMFPETLPPQGITVPKRTKHIL